MEHLVLVTVDGKGRLAERGSTVAALIPSLSLPCGGGGRCGKCRVLASGALSPVDEAERAHLTADQLASGMRLACRAVILGPCSVTTLREDAAPPLPPSAPVLFCEDAAQGYGAAVDLGTTTLVLRLFAPSGRAVIERACPNPQRAYGADVISRIEAAMAGKAKALAAAVRGGIDALLCDGAREAGISPRAVTSAVITGNTAMLCLLAGIDPTPLSRAPFSLPDRFGREWTAEALGIDSLAPSVPIYLPPVLSPFVGGDTACALLAADLKSGQMLCDVGTNGEVALRVGERLLVCSCAAGPAMEGATVGCGMSGEKGAIDRVMLIDGALRFHVIGEGEPKGICASGLIDALDALYRRGDLSESGYAEGGKIALFPSIALTGEEIRALLSAKSAVCAAICSLLHACDRSVEQIDRLVLAGGLGSRLNPRSAVRIGLIPSIPIDRIDAVGNAALEGAQMLLLCPSLRRRVEEEAAKAEVVEIATDPFFADAFVKGLTLAP